MQQAMFTKHSKLKFVKPGDTLCFKLYDVSLKQLVTSEEWDAWTKGNEAALHIEHPILSAEFWVDIEKYVKVLWPIVVMLCMVDRDVFCMGVLYEGIDQMLEQIKEVLKEEVDEVSTLEDMQKLSPMAWWENYGTCTFKLQRLAIQVGKETLGGLLALGYQVAVSYKRESEIFDNGSISICIETVDDLDRSFVLVRGKDRKVVAAQASSLGMEGPWITKSYLELVLEKKGLPRLGSPPLPNSAFQGPISPRLSKTPDTAITAPKPLHLKPLNQLKTPDAPEPWTRSPTKSEMDSPPVFWRLASAESGPGKGLTDDPKRAKTQLQPILEALDFDRGLLLGIQGIQTLLNAKGSPVIVGIGGPSGSGKTSLAYKMANIMGCEVISLENYYRSEQVRDFKYDDFSSLDLPLLLKNIRELRSRSVAMVPLFDFEKNVRSAFKPVEVSNDCGVITTPEPCASWKVGAAQVISTSLVCIAEKDPASRLYSSCDVRGIYWFAEGQLSPQFTNSVLSVFVGTVREVIIEGVYALHPHIRNLLDFWIAVVGGVHSHLIARVQRDLERSQRPVSSEDIMRTLFPMFQQHIEPHIVHAHLKIQNDFDPVHSPDSSLFVLKSSKEVRDHSSGIKRVFVERAGLRVNMQETYPVKAEFETSDQAEEVLAHCPFN
ncbi:hypothetical protein L7F22_032016 [Adiantum nelumboides]|nr:hypothetical protein [Adiantum nelumboides]